MLNLTYFLLNPFFKNVLNRKYVKFSINIMSKIVAAQIRLTLSWHNLQAMETFKYNTMPKTHNFLS